MFNMRESSELSIEVIEYIHGTSILTQFIFYTYIIACNSEGEGWKLELSTKIPGV